jgi:hypothetical protein
MYKTSSRITFRLSGNAVTRRSCESSNPIGIPVVKIPVRCHHCDAAQLCEFPEPVVVMALTRWNNMNLYVPCHDGYWSASKGVLDAIRQHLGESWIAARALSVVTQHPRLHICV